MSDDEFYYDDIFEWEEEPFSAMFQDDMAEKTMHSPVLIGYDPYFDILDYIGEQDDSADEYHDFPHKIHRARKTTTGVAQKHCGNKWAKIDPTESNNPAAPRSPVLWQSKKDMLESRELPVFVENQAQTVSLMKDWRELLSNVATQAPSNSKKTRGRKTKKKQKQSQVKSKLSSHEKFVLDVHALEADGSIDGTLDEPTAELPPTILTETSTITASEQKCSTRVNSADSSLAKKPLRQAANENSSTHDLDIEEDAPQSENDEEAFWKLDDTLESQQDAKQEDNARKEPKTAETKKKVGRPKGKRKGLYDEEQPPAKKATTTRRRKTSTSADVSPKVTRQTRSKNQQDLRPGFPSIR
ncbi:uncharacterized protein KY384_000622 [Bacidia gigantensis]|uniref:uncharacterized protein n=1 Tax=Bacidia gigantensis TaxID=2732470 RepID=UPI001D04A160|nr:uncharacterized protein KY384_000622 [Bacidia gigantensis]KAG8525862.1 hypothetical protein KY384_000622 [Bacidia gigantensis]